MRMVAKGPRLFIDPGSNSAGWALFDGPTLIDSGTIAAKKNRNQFVRLAEIVCGFRAVFQLDYLGKTKISEVHIETLNYQTAYACIWSVGVIGTLFASHGAAVSQDVFITAWQKHANWKEEKVDWKVHGCTSEDEFAARCMGRWWLAKLQGDIE